MNKKIKFSFYIFILVLVICSPVIYISLHNFLLNLTSYKIKDTFVPSNTNNKLRLYNIDNKDVKTIEEYGLYPNSINKPILNTYPLTSDRHFSHSGYAYNWRRYPVFELPSFTQTTNNLRYYNNPDNGTCTPSEFCFTLYNDKEVKSNQVFPLKEVDNGDGARVGYGRTNANLLYFSIPTNENIYY